MAKGKKYSIDGRYNKQLARAQRRQKTGVIIFICVALAAVVAMAILVFGSIFQVIE
jgi:hypothetical protein